MKKNSALAWLSIGVALASAVGIVFLPNLTPWFLAIILLNLLITIVFHKHYDKPALTV